MKKLSFMIMVASMIFMFSSCKQNAKGDAEEIPVEETAEEATSEKAEPRYSHLGFVWHGVEDFDKWKAVYDSADSMIEANGETKVAIGRSTEDANYIIVAHAIHDMDASKAFGESDELKEAMVAAGVNSEPEVIITEVIMLGEADRDNDHRLMVSHKVEDWDAFMGVYESEANKNMEDYHGSTPIFLGRDIMDPNRVHMVFVIHDSEEMKAWRESEEIKDLFKQATIIEGASSSSEFKIIYTE